MASEAVILVLRILTALSAFVVILSPAPAIYRIHKNKSVGHLTIFPLASLLANSHMWMLYGYFRGNIFPVMISFGFGDLATAAYIIIYYRNAPLTQQRKFLQVLAVLCSALFGITIYSIVAAVGATNQNYEQISHVVGVFAILTAIALYGAPFFEKFVYVMRTKNAQPIQIVMVICGFVNNSLWVIYTALDGNWLQFIPNAICVPLGITMLVLYVLYKPRHPTTVCQTPQDAGRVISIVIETPKAEIQEKERTTSVRYEPLVSPLAPVAAVTITSNAGSGHSLSR